MSSFSNAKVLVVDDKYSDAGPMIKALWNLGVGALFVTGKEDKLPKLTGVRLAILDLDLGMKYTGGSEPVSILQRIVDETNGPYAAIIWTGVEEEIDGFLEELEKLKPEQKPFYLRAMIKEKFIDNDEYDLDLIEKEISSILSLLAPFDILVEWEGRVSKSASRTLFEVGKLAEIGMVHKKCPLNEYPIDSKLPDLLKKWLLSLRIILGSITMEAIGSISETEEGLLLSILTALKPLLIDCIDIEMGKFNKGKLDDLMLRILESIVCEKGMPKGRYKKDARILPFADEFGSQLMGMLHLGEPHRNALPYPGNVFKYESISNTDSIAFDFAPIDNLLAEGFKKTDGAEFQEVREADTRVLLEITPECDYVQNKVTNSRFVAGFFFPQPKLGDSWRKPEYCSVLGPIQPDGFGDISKQGYLIFNLHYIATVPHDMVRGVAPIFRLKRQFLTSLQIALGGNISRQGILQIGIK